MSIRRTVAVAIVSGVLLAGCGADDETAVDPQTDPGASAGQSPDPGEAEPGAEGEPQCADVWVDGATLPEEYDGCFEGANRVDAERRYCESGADLFTYDDRFYAADSSRVNDVDGSLGDSEAYANALASCGG